MGLSEKEIEMLYIEHNNFKIIRTPILYDENKSDHPRHHSYPSSSQTHVNIQVRISKGLLTSFSIV